MSMTKQFSIRVGYRLTHTLSQNFCQMISISYMPGPASTVGDRPPTNSAIRVRFPLKGTKVRPSPRFFLFRRDLRSQTCLTETTNYRTSSSNHATSKKKSNNPIYWRKLVFKSSLYEGERSPENRSYDVSILGSGMTSYIPTTQF